VCSAERLICPSYFGCVFFVCEIASGVDASGTEVAPLTCNQMGAGGAGRFHDAIAAAKSGKYVAAVTRHPQEDYVVTSV
jgi:hypothetical protein